MVDQHGRRIEYMRISITDRCNFRCKYCMPEDVDLVEMDELLTFEEIVSVVQQAAKLGIRKIKITGGEPLVRKGCCELIGMIKKVPGIEQVTLTTNGALLERNLPDLLKNGLDAVNISLDTLDAEVFETITGRNEFAQVMSGIQAALDSHIPVKINVVLQQGINHKEWKSLAELSVEQNLDVRFIEVMPIGYGKSFPVIGNDKILGGLKAYYPELQSDDSVHGNGPAIYYKIPRAKGSVGFISAIHGKFCQSCNRIRMTAQGQIKPCLCYGQQIDLKPIIREIKDPLVREKKIQDLLKEAIVSKPMAHCFESEDQITELKQMVQIGG